MRPVSLDHADKQIEEKLPLGGRQRRKNAVVGSEIFGDQAPAKFRRACCKMQLARPTICTIHAAVDETHRLKLIDNLTGIDGNDTDGFGQSALVETRRSIDTGKRSPLKRREVLSEERFGNHRGANLLEMPR